LKKNLKDRALSICTSLAHLNQNNDI